MMLTETVTSVAVPSRSGRDAGLPRRGGAVDIVAVPSRSGRDETADGFPCGQKVRSPSPQGRVGTGKSRDGKGPRIAVAVPSRSGRDPTQGSGGKGRKRVAVPSRSGRDEPAPLRAGGKRRVAVPSRSGRDELMPAVIKPVDPGRRPLKVGSGHCLTRMQW